MDTASPTNLSTTLLHYWRNSLADVEKKQVSSPSTIEFGSRELQDGVIPSVVLKQLGEQWQRDNTKSRKPANPADEPPATLPVLMAPILLKVRKEHGRSQVQGASVLHPLWIPAQVSSEGRLSPAPDRLPWITRESLEPNAGSTITVGTVEDVDAFLTQESANDSMVNWADMLAYADRMWTRVTGASMTAYALEEYVRQGAGICLDTESRGIAEPLLSLYDKLQTGSQATPLLDQLCAKLMRKPDSSSLVLHDAGKRHLGHISAQPLTVSQRLGLYATLALSGTNELLAINGPPGTGKTTLLQSIIASLWVDAAVKGGEPPVILVTSTNNRAVTNVIESFARAGVLADNHPLAGNIITQRWLPDLQGYGLYFRSRTSETGFQNTMREVTPQGPRWTDFVEMVETFPYCERATQTFLEAFRGYSGHQAASLEAAVTELHRQLQAAVGAQTHLLETHQALLQLAADMRAGVVVRRPDAEFDNAAAEKVAPSLDEISALLQELSTRVDQAQARRDAGRNIRDQVAKAAAPKGLLEVLFAFIPAIRMQPWIRARTILEKHRFRKLIDRYASKPPTYTELTAHLNAYVLRQEASLTDAETKLLALQTAERAWRSQAESLVAHYQEPNSSAALSDFDQLERFLDTHLRVELFHLAGRYWEGRWLLEMHDPDLKLDRQSWEHCEARFRRLAKLTPCMVATPFMAARYFDYFDGKSNPLTDFLDLLIVDEAGQVRPDIGIPIFALAKRAVVVGDIHQIEPVWEQPVSVDFGNLKTMGLSRAFDFLADSGSLVSNGSLMKMARYASAYNQPNDRGVFLAEHFRCLEEIISYCNELTYKGKLIPSRADNGAELLAVMGYAHIDSPPDRLGGSWANPGEANAIAAWLARHKAEFLGAYPKLRTLGDVLAIVTPFRAQARAIAEALERAGLSNDGIIVGTVHAMQGGERPVILFSPTLAPKSTGTYFFDRGPNMLNVAVSRAKDSFLVFGNAGLFDAERQTPSGLLGKWLFAEAGNEITDVDQASRFPLQEQDQIEHIQSLMRHRQLLTTALREARQKVLIVSPYISIRALEADNLLPAFTEALQRGVTIKVVVGSDMDIEHNGRKRENAAQAIQALRAINVDVIEIPRIHNKTLAIDDSWLVEGSFNWLSAVRDESSKFQRAEQSISVRGPSAAKRIPALWEQIATPL